MNQRKDDKKLTSPNKQIAWCITVTFPQLQRGVSEEQQTIESDSQASTGIINNCKSCWWTWGNRGTVGRYAQRKIHLNEPNQSNIHQAFCALCQAQTTLEPYRNTCGRKTAKHQNTSGTEEQEDGVLPLLTPSSISVSVMGSCPWPSREHGCACSCQRPHSPAPGLLCSPPQETEQRSEEPCT